MAAIAAIAAILTVLPIHLALAGPATALAPVIDADGRLGFCNVLPGNVPLANGPSWAQLAYNAGARVNRWEFRWDRMEAQRGSWDFSANDAAVTSSLQVGLSVEGILIGTPGWSVVKGQRPGNGVPRGLNLPIDDPDNLWATYVRATVAHYAGKVAYWEVWNEPDLQFFWPHSPEEYARLLKVASKVIRATDPHARVILAGMVVDNFGFLSRVLDAAVRDKAAGSLPFDIAAWHAYGPAAALYANVVHLRGVLQSRRLNVPIWVTEAGFPASDPNGEPRQAAYVVQGIAYAFAAGARKVLIYRESDDPTPKSWGLLTAAGMYRLGYFAFQVAAHYFANLQTMVHAPTSRLERFVLYSPGRRVTMLWNRGTTDVTLELREGRSAATLVDSAGTTTPLAAPQGSVKITVPGAAYNVGVDPKGFVVGGPPIFVVEDTTPPAATGAVGFVPPVPGDNRRLVVVNPTDVPQSALLSAADDATERQALELPSHSVRTVDLDLLAGPGYGGAFVLQGTHALPTRAVSSGANIDALQPASNWFAAGAPDALQVSNPSSTAAHVVLSTYDRGGHQRAKSRLELQPFATTLWRRPTNMLNSSLSLRASRPVVAANQTSGGPPVLADSRPSWYVVRPGKGHFVVFNPGSAPIRVDIHFVHAPTVKEEQLRLAPRHSYALSGHGAKVLTIAATGNMVVGSNGGAQGARITAQPETEVGYAAAGSATRVDLFNPSTQPAHVILDIVTAASIRQVIHQIAPAQIYAVQVRKFSGPPSGVLVHSDVPVVSAPAG